MLNTLKLSSKMPENSNADKAQYYKVILDNERTVREQADKEIIELLHDVKQRYESKLKSYMAKKQPGGGGDHTDKSPAKDSKKGQVNGTAQETQNDDWGAQTQNDDWGATTQNDDWGAATTTQNDDWATTAQNDDWGTETETPAKDTNNKENSKKNNKGDNKKNKNDKKNKEKEEEKKKDNDDWGNSTETPTQQTQNDDWGATTQNDDWGTTTETPANNSTTSNNKDSKKNNKGDNKKNKNDKKNKEKEKSKDDDGWGNSTETPAQQTQNDDWGATTQNDDWGTTTETPANDSSKNKDSKKNKDDNGSKDPQASGQTQAQEQKATGPAQPSKEFLDMKSQLWTAKLDLRLLEREKSKLTDEVSTIRAERDDLIKKMAQANQEQDSMKVKVRGLTVDLLAANDEIHKLNERIDELEAERRNRERDVNFSENKRRSMECRYKNYQQQIADLQSELSLIKEEKLEFEKTATELAKRNERLENDLSHSKSLIRTLKDGCALVENQARTFEIRHDTVIMSKADLERELIAIKEESSRHITTINKLQKSNEQISKAFIQSVEAHEACKKEVEKLHREYSRKLEGYQIENLRLVEANKQLRKVIDHLQKKR